MDARRLRRKNAKVLQVAIEQSEREAAEAARVAKLNRQHDMVVRRMKGLIVLSESSFDHGGDHDSSHSADRPPTVDAYSCASDRMGKDPGRKW